MLPGSHSFPVKPEGRGGFAREIFLLPFGWKSARAAILHPRRQQAWGAAAPLILGAACQALQQGAGSASACGKMEPGFSSWARTATTLKRAVTKCSAQGVWSLFTLAGRTRVGSGSGVSRVPKETRVRKLLWSTMLCLGGRWKCWLFSEILLMANFLNSLKHQGCLPAMGTQNKQPCKARDWKACNSGVCILSCQCAQVAGNHGAAPSTPHRQPFFKFCCLPLA